MSVQSIVQSYSPSSSQSPVPNTEFFPEAIAQSLPNVTDCNV
ncbi:MAG TPA: hypothetical protein V6D25_26485 [Leptolyngbyaceae cyanobacterium]